MRCGRSVRIYLDDFHFHDGFSMKGNQIFTPQSSLLECDLGFARRRFSWSFGEYKTIDAVLDDIIGLLKTGY